MAHRRKALIAAAAVVVFVVAYALTLPAITLDRDTASQDSGISVSETENATSNGTADGSGAEAQSATATSGLGVSSGTSDASGGGSDGDGASAGSDINSAALPGAQGSGAEGSTSVGTTGTGEEPDVALSEAVKKAEGYEDTVTGEAKLEATGLPEGVELLSEEIGNDEENAESYQRLHDAALARLKEDDPSVEALSSAYFFNVAFTGADGTDAQLQDGADLTFTSEEPLQVGETSAVKVVRFDEEDLATPSAEATDVLEDADVEANVSDGQTDRVAFKASRAAVYGVVVAEARDDSAEHELTAENDSYKVTLTYTAAAELPEGARLRLSNVVSSSDEYAQARAAVLAAKQVEDEGFDEGSLGLAALDIGIVDADGNEMEPAAEVHVQVEAKALPEEASASGVEVRHVVQAADEGEPQTEDGMTARAVATDVQPDGTSAKAEFDVDAFSVFTITWTKSTTDATRVANVRVHYMSESGAELTERPTTTPTSTLAAGVSTKLADWANDAQNSNTTRLAGYTYRGAHLETVDGTVVTELQAVAGTDGSYTLQYKTAGDSDWTTYEDSVSGKSENDVDVYLLFSKTPSVTVHYVDVSGNDINGDATDTKNVEDLGSGVSVSTWAKTIDGYSLMASNPARMGSATGTLLTSVRAVENADGTYALQAQYGASGTWADMTSADVYLVYEKKSFTRKITLHYVDVAGVAIKDASGNAVTKAIDAADWTSADVVKRDSSGNGYVDLSAWADSFDGYAAWDSSSINAGDEDGCGLMYSPAQPTNEGCTRGAVTGRNFRFIRYDSSSNALYIGRGRLSDPNVAAGNDGAINNDIDVYLFYRRALRIHYVDRQGNELYDTFSKEGVIKNQTSYSSYDLTSTEAQNGHGTPVAVYDKAPTDESEIAISSLAWKYDGGWKTQVTPTSGDAEERDGVVTDVYMVYDRSQTVTVHHIDTNGNAVGSDETKTISDTTTLTASNTSDFTTPSGYTPTGKGYLGYQGSSDKGTEFAAVTYTRTDGSWSSSYTTSGGTSTALTSVPSELWIEYAKTQDNQEVVFHYVDASGNTLASDTHPGWTVSSTENFGTRWDGWSRGVDTYKKDIAGYTFKAIYIGDQNREANRYTNEDGTLKGSAIVWRYRDGVWHTGYGVTATTNDSQETEVYLDDNDTSGYMTDIYVVYTKDNNLTVHYVYLDSDGGVKRISTKSDQTVANSALGKGSGSATRLSDDTYAPTPITSGSSTYEYVGTRIGPAWSDTLTSNNLGPNVRGVYLDDDQLVYYGSTTSSLSYLRRNTWYHDEADGRRFVLTRSGSTGSYNYTLSDSRHGSLSLNYASANTYTASFHGENQTTEYTLTVSGSSYTLTVSDWLPNDQTDVYEIYQDTTSQKIWLDDDLKYSGYLKVGTASDLTSARNKTYTWYRTVTNSAGETTTEQVSRKLTGEHYNIEYSPSSRTWLDVEADEGGLNSTTQTAVSYYVVLTYTDGEGNTQTATSNTVDIQYYSELMNGSFETPSKTDSATPPTASWSTDYSNADYKKYGGVWQTTGTGTGEDDYSSNSRVGSDIEIVNISNKSSVARSYRFSSADAVTTADDGVQFAELNAETAGALYQDVVTHPNQQLHYWFSHRARGYKADTTPEYDTMYVVIMPTKLAMTSAADGGELKTQEDLETFINAHGGYATEVATGIEEEITYKDDSNGILILKVSSSDQAWHNVTMINNYLAKAGLTRFFFAAGPTAYQNNDTEKVNKRGNITQGELEKTNPTHGNFIDAIGFSQSLPPTTGFNLSVSKTFSGLSEETLAGLAGNASTAGIEGVTAASNPYTITISDTYYDSSGRNDELANAALNGASLGFDVSGSGGSLTFTPTATLDGSSLLMGNNSASVRRNDDGSITMTWTFLDQELRSVSGTEASDRQFYYTAKESNTNVSGYSLDPTETVTRHYTDGTTSTVTRDSQYVVQGESLVYNLTNSYKDSASSDQPQMIVTKTFSGVTASTVDEMLGGGYELQVTKTDGSSSVGPLTLVGNVAAPVKRDENEDEDIARLSVSLTSTDNDDGSVTLRWIIEGWGPGTYTIKEVGYNASATTSGDTNKLSQVTVNGKDQTVETNDTTGITATGLEIGGTGSGKVSSLSFGGASSVVSSPALDTAVTLGDTTNLLIAKYTLGDDVRYIVWTPETLSASTSQAIINKINELWNSGGTSTDTVAFKSSANPGTLDVKDAGNNVVGSVTYDSETHQLSFAKTSEGNQLTWDGYYATHYSLASDSSSINEDDIIVANQYVPIVKVQKVSAEDSSALPGAMFHVYKRDQDTKSYLLANGTFGTPADGNEAKEFTTGSDGVISIGALPKDTSNPTTYYLEEATAPAGYNRNSDIAFVVNADGTVQLVGPNDDGGKPTYVSSTDVASLTWNDPYYTITVKDTAGIALPLTGGSGTAFFTVVGLALMVASLMVGHTQRRRRQGRRA